MNQEVQKTFEEQLARLREIRRRNMALELISEMQSRVSIKPLDKVAGLAYPLIPHAIPIYDAEKSDVDAWEILVDAMWSLRRAEFFFYVPKPGKGKKCWRPSWQQAIMVKKVVPYSFPWHGEVHRTEDTDEDWYEGYCIDSADLRGVAEIQKEEKP